jgi:mannosyltransferase OCH1-like enzyme
MQQYFGEYYDIYATVPYPIMKVDILRYCLLYWYGGMYVDMDYRVFRNLDSYIATLSPDIEIAINQSRDMLLNRLASTPKVCNSLIICPRSRSVLMGELIREMFRRIPGRRPLFHINFVFKTTGPNLWNDLMVKWRTSGAISRIHILPWEQFNYCNECGICKASANKPVYAVHAYDSKWNKSWFLWVRRNIICRPWIVAIIVIFILTIVSFKL